MKGEDARASQVCKAGGRFALRLCLPAEREDSPGRVHHAATRGLLHSPGHNVHSPVLALRLDPSTLLQEHQPIAKTAP
jgi:hypothetical protein